MSTIKEYNDIGKELEQNLHLKYAPMAIKLITENEIPEGCIRPLRDKGVHYALCQAFAAVRRDRKALALFKEDHWCVWPIVNFRLGNMEDEDYDYMGTKLFIKDDAKSIKYFREKFPVINEDKQKPGLAIAPLASCTFEPDIICIYCFPGQLRQLLMAAKFNTAEIVGSNLDTVGSCGYAIVPVFNGMDYNVSIPDPGEYERSLCDEDEMVFTLRAEKLDELISCIRMINERGFGYKQLSLDMNLDYPRHEFYNHMFEKWGLDTGDSWKNGER